MWSAGSLGVGDRHLLSPLPQPHTVDCSGGTKARASRSCAASFSRRLPCRTGVQRRGRELRLRQGRDHRRERDLRRPHPFAGRRAHGRSLRQGDGSHPGAARLAHRPYAVARQPRFAQVPSTTCARATTGASPNSRVKRANGKAWPRYERSRGAPDLHGNTRCTGRSLTVDTFANVAGSGDALAYQLQSYTNPRYRSGGGVVVFRRRGPMLTPVIATAVDGVHFNPPTMLQSPEGKLLDVSGTMDGTGAFNAARSTSWTARSSARSTPRAG